MRGKILALAAASILLMALFPWAGTALAQVRAAGIVGTVTDPTGGVMPGATVTVTSPALQVPQVMVVTDAQGQYRITPLPVGTYTVTYEVAGFQTVRQEGVRLEVGFVATLDQALRPGDLTETVTVTGVSPTVDVTNPAHSVNLANETLETLPTNRDGLKAYLGQVPGIRTNLDVGSSSMTDTVQIRQYGQVGNPWLLLDGVMFGGAQNGVQGAQIDFNSIDSTRVEIVGSNADMPKPGQLVDSVLKSGGNEYHGEIVMYGSSGNLESSNLNDELRTAGVRNVPALHGLWDFSANTGGRLIRDRLWFFANYRNQGYDRDILNAFYPATGFGENSGKPLQTNTRGRLWLTKLSLQVSESNRLTGFYHSNREQQRRRGSQFIGPDGRELNEGPFLTYGSTWQTVKGTSLVMALTAGHFHRHSITYALPLYDGYGPTAVKTVDLTTQFVTGDAPNDTQFITHGNDTVSGNVRYFKPNMAGSHQFKVGFDHVRSWHAQEFDSQPAGNYTLRYQNGVPVEIETYNYPVKPENYQRYLGVFAQDNWSVTDRLSLALGIRFARDNVYAPAQCSLVTDFSAAQCYDKVQLPIWTSTVPRLNFAYDLQGDGRSVIKGGWGRYVTYGSITSDLLQNARNNRQVTRFLWHDNNGDRLYQPGEVNLDPTGGDFLQISGVTNGVVNPAMPQPKSDQFILGYEREVVRNWNARATGIYYRNFDLRRTETISIPYDAYSVAITNPDPGFDGRAGTSDDPGRSITYYEYPSSLSGIGNQATRYVGWPGEQTYKTIELAASRRLSGGWQFNTSWVATKIDQPFTDGQELNPNSEINTALNYWEFTSKVSGGYMFPWFGVAVDYQHRSGTPQAPQFQFTGGTTIRNLVVNTLPVGSIALPSTDLANIRLTRLFRMGGGRSLETRFDFFNVLNANFVTGRNVRQGANYLVPSGVILPRILQIGVSFKY
jgi:hypothetical protein